MATAQSPRIDLATQLSYALRMLPILRRRSLKGWRLLGEMERIHPREPHWYLALLGTEPKSQGKGIGSALLRPILRRCDNEGSPIYLESSKQSNLSYYRRHGFEIVCEIQIPDGPTVWPMLRRPK